MPPRLSPPKGRLWVVKRCAAAQAFLPPSPSPQGACVAIEDPSRKFFGLQYHPEVVHSERGSAMIKWGSGSVCWGTCLWDLVEAGLGL